MIARRPSSVCLVALAIGLAGCGGAAGSARETPHRAARAARTEAFVSPEGTVEPVDAVYPAPGARRVTIGASGDILLHLKVIRAAAEHADEGGFARVFDALRAIIGPDEVAFANLETPLSSRIEAVTGAEPVLGAPAEVARALSGAGVDVVSVANNHAYDQTAAGMDDTLRALAAADVHAVGAAQDEWSAPGPVIVERDGARVALVAYTVRLNRGPGVVDEPYARVAREEEAFLVAALARAREQADVVVLSIHWSGDFVRAPLDRQRVRARELVDAGADLILGHGPHVLQEVERLTSPRGDALVA
jgi:poly-gamma-glutamate synthesis protein (capsule biosynthesis protein)